MTKNDNDANYKNSTNKATAASGSPFNLQSSLQIRTEQSKDGREILVINNRYIHSRFKPAREGAGESYEGVNVISIFGLGYAYHLNNLLKNNPQSYFIIYEPVAELFAKGVSMIDRGLMESCRERILLLDRLDEGVIYNFLQKLDIHLYNRIKSYSNQGYKNLFPQEETGFYQKIQKCFEMIVQNLMTEVNFIPLWTKNIIYNMAGAGNIPFLKERSENRGDNLALIVCAGPTLDRDLEQIKANREQLTIFAVDTALKPLLAHEINPDFIVSLDGQFYTLDDFVEVDSDEITFVFDILSYPKAVSLVKNSCFTATENIYESSILKTYLEGLGIEGTTLETGGTVADYTMQLAIKMGFKKLYFAGLDLSFPELVTHCKGSPYHNRLLATSSYFEPPRTQIAKIISLRNVTDAPNRAGGQVFSDFVLKNYGAYFENFCKFSSEHSFYYGKSGALKLDGFETVALEELLGNIDSKRVGKAELLEDAESNIASEGAALNLNKSEAEKLYRLAEELKTVLETVNFESIEPELVPRMQAILQEAYSNHPYLKKFVLMTALILGKKSITESHLIWYKHIFFKLLQSIYYLIRTLQKAIKIGE